MIRGIHHVAIHTPNMAALMKFYRDAFGFEPVGPEMSWEPNPHGDKAIGVKNSAGKLQLMKAGNAYIEIFEFASPPSRPDGAARASDHGYTHFGIEVTDIDAEFERLKKLGMRFFPDKPLDVGPIKSAYGQDPDGNIIELQQMPKDLDQAFDHLRVK